MHCLVFLSILPLLPLASAKSFFSRNGLTDGRRYCAPDPTTGQWTDIVECKKGKEVLITNCAKRTDGNTICVTNDETQPACSMPLVGDMVGKGAMRLREGRRVRDDMMSEEVGSRVEMEMGGGPGRRQQHVNRMEMGGGPSKRQDMYNTEMDMELGGGPGKRESMMISMDTKLGGGPGKMQADTMMTQKMKRKMGGMHARPGRVLK
ncbi:hypothetical protein F5Y16DRAFT_399444 [Xylariaceae sp. FL0255]|nr:hypothetical protein F5Y16DRAFT_399444 [Xylariaceae sp. FL0255]